MQCKGRHTLERKNIPQLKFANKPKFGFFLPMRCKNTAITDICESCLGRSEKIPALLERWKGTMQNQSEQLHGLIGGPIPKWSRLYKSPYYESKIASGWTIADESARIAEEAYTEVERDTIEMAPKKKVLAPPVPIPVLAPEPVPVPAVVPKKKVIAPKTVGPAPMPAPVPAPMLAPVSAPVPVVAPKKKVLAPKAIQPSPVPASPPPPPPPVKAKSKAPVKKVVAVSIPTHIIEPLPEEPLIVSIKVKKIEIDGRTVYLNSEKDKVYDMKYNYLGRYNRRQDKIDSTYADSDVED